MNTTERGFFAVLTHFRDAMLCTRQADGTLRARPMIVARVQPNGDLWFVTGVTSGKVDEVLGDPRVVVTFQSKDRYLSISGSAEVVGDENLIEALWRDEWDAWFPEGRDDPRLVLLHLRATQAEYWDESSTHGARYVFRAARKALRGKRTRPEEEEEHGRLML